MKPSLYPESYDMNSNLELFINASVCTYSHAGNDKGMLLQQQRELQLCISLIVTGSASRVSSRTVSTYNLAHKSMNPVCVFLL